MNDANPIDLAVQHHRAGRLKEAAEIYSSVLQQEPNHIDALNLLSALAYQRGDDVMAAELSLRVMSVDERVPQPHYHLGLVRLRQGNLPDAAKSFERLLKVAPNNVTGHHSLGIVLRLQGDLDAAAQAQRQVLLFDSDHAGAHYELGLIGKSSGKLAEALESFRRAADLLPRSAEPLDQLAEVASSLGEAAVLVHALQKAAALEPRSAGRFAVLGDAWHARGRLAEAICAYRQALEVDPNRANAWWGLACAQGAMGEHADAVESFRQVVRLAPGHGEAHHNLGKHLFELGKVDLALDSFREAIAKVNDPELPLGMIATVIPGSDRTDPAGILEARQTWARRYADAVPRKDFTRLRGSSDHLIRVGYVSAFFQKRNWMKPVWGLINHHDRDRFEVHLFADAAPRSLEPGYHDDPRDRFHDVRGLTNPELARVIEDHQIDILVDLNGYSRLPRLQLFALRPAPVLISWFNHYATSGMDCFDCLLGDPHVFEPGEASFFREPVECVPGSYLAFDVNYPTPDVVVSPCRERGFVTFGCLAPQYKITPRAVETWSAILQASPGSRLALKNSALCSEGSRRYLRDLFGRFGIVSGRLDLEGPAEHFEFLEKYGDIDVALDTFPYNGGTTTMESLWQGVPVLTFFGDRWASRISASLLRNARLPEFVAVDRDGYIDQAITLANSSDTPARLERLRLTMRQNLKDSSACDTAAFARDIEAAYARAWHGRFNPSDKGLASTAVPV